MACPPEGREVYPGTEGSDIGSTPKRAFAEGAPSRQSIVGRTATDRLGPPRWAETYGRVVETGKPVRIKEAELMLGRVFDLNIFRLGEAKSRRVAVQFTMIPACASTVTRPGFRVRPAGIAGAGASAAS